jgi:hypothetical protein
LIGINIVLFFKKKIDDCNIFIYLKSFISNINPINIVKIWKVKDIGVNIKSVNYVALFQDNSYTTCIYLLLASKDLIYHYFFQIMLQSESANFAFSLLKS